MVSSWQACIRAVQFVCVLVCVCSVRVCACVSLSPEWAPLADSGNWSGEWRVQLYSDPYSHVPLLSVMVLVLSWHLPGLYVSTWHLWALNYFRNSHPQSICKDHTVPLWITPVLLRTNWSFCGLNWSLWGSHDPLEDHTCPLEDLHLFLLPRNFSLQTPGVCSCMFCHVLGLEWPDGIPAMVVVTACMAVGVIVHSREEECRECTKRKSVQTQTRSSTTSP